MELWTWSSEVTRKSKPFIMSTMLQSTQEGLQTYYEGTSFLSRGAVGCGDGIQKSSLMVNPHTIGYISENFMALGPPKLWEEFWVTDQKVPVK